MTPRPPTREAIAAAVHATLGAAPGATAGDCRNAGIMAVYLFGSCARGTATAGSDVDLGLLYAEPPAAKLLAQPFLLQAQLAEQLERPVQCVVMNSAPADLVHQILSDESLLLDANPSRRIRFEVDARNRYFDLKPLLDRYRRVPPRRANGAPLGFSWRHHG